MDDTTKSQWIVEVLDRYETRLVRYATWILGNTDCAREVVQETFLRLCREDRAAISDYLSQWFSPYAETWRSTPERRRAV